MWWFLLMAGNLWQTTKKAGGGKGDTDKSGFAGLGGGGGVRGGDRSMEELGILNMQGKEKSEEARRNLSSGGGDFAQGFVGGGSGNFAGNYGGGDKSSGMGSREDKEGECLKKDPENPINQKNLLVEASNGALVNRGNKKDNLVRVGSDNSNDIMVMGPHTFACARIFLSQVCHRSSVLLLSILNLNFFPCAKLQKDGPAHLNSSPIFLKPTYILNLSHFNLVDSKPNSPSTSVKTFYFHIKIGLMDQILITETTCFPTQFRHCVYPTQPSYDSNLIPCPQLLYRSYHIPPPNPPLSTTYNTHPIITNFLHNFRQNQPLNHDSAFTRPYHIHVTTHLEDKVEVWAAGSGNYGGVDRVVNGVAGVRDPTGTPSDCEGGWKGIGYECGGYGGCRREFGGFARIIFDPGAHRSFLFLTTVMENLWAAASSSFLFLTTVMENLWAAGNEILWWDDSRSNLLNLEMEGSFIHEHFRLKFDHGSIGFSRKKLQHKEIHGKVSSSIEIQVKLQPREGEDSNKYLESSPSVKRRPTFCSYSLADNLIFMVFIPSFIKIVRDYYPP